MGWRQLAIERTPDHVVLYESDREDDPMPVGHFGDRCHALDKDSYWIRGHRRWIRLAGPAMKTKELNR